MTERWPCRASLQRADEREALFDVLYEEHRQTLHAFFLGRTSDPELALDLLQEAFIRAWRNLDMLLALPPRRQRAWLFAIGRNLVIDQYRGQRDGRPPRMRWRPRRATTRRSRRAPSVPSSEKMSSGWSRRRSSGCRRISEPCWCSRCSASRPAPRSARCSGRRPGRFAISSRGRASCWPRSYDCSTSARNGSRSGVGRAIPL